MGRTFYVGPFKFQGVSCQDGILLIMSLRGTDGSVIVDEWCIKEQVDLDRFAQSQARIKLHSWLQEC